MLAAVIIIEEVARACASSSLTLSDRDAKITQIYEGTNQIQRVVMARHILGGTADAP